MTGRRALDPRRFVREQTRLLPVSHAPEIVLHVADHATDLWQKTEEELGEMGLPPPFWAFAWAGGQGLARYILDNPDTVRNRSVFDFASGSGLVAIAAALAGAAETIAADIDPFAGAAIAANAEANGVGERIRAMLGDPVGTDGGWDVVLAGDIFYERATAARVIAWLEALRARGAAVLIGDPGRSYLPRARLEELARYRVPTTRELEDSDIKATSVWRLRA